MHELEAKEKPQFPDQTNSEIDSEWAQQSNYKCSSGDDGDGGVANIHHNHDQITTAITMMDRACACVRCMWRC